MNIYKIILCGTNEFLVFRSTPDSYHFEQISKARKFDGSGFDMNDFFEKIKKSYNAWKLEQKYIRRRHSKLMCTCP